MNSSNETLFSEQATEMEDLYYSLYNKADFHKLYDEFMEKAKNLKSYSEGIEEKLQSLDNEELSEILNVNIDIEEITNVKAEFEKDCNSTISLSFDVLFQDGNHIEISMWYVYEGYRSEYNLEYENKTYSKKDTKSKKLPKKIRAFFKYIIEEFFAEMINEYEEFV